MSSWRWLAARGAEPHKSRPPYGRGRAARGYGCRTLCRCTSGGCGLLLHRRRPSDNRCSGRFWFVPISEVRLSLRKRAQFAPGSSPNHSCAAEIQPATHFGAVSERACRIGLTHNLWRAVLEQGWVVRQRVLRSFCGARRARPWISRQENANGLALWSAIAGGRRQAMSGYPATRWAFRRCPTPRYSQGPATAQFCRGLWREIRHVSVIVSRAW